MRHATKRHPHPPRNRARRAGAAGSPVRRLAVPALAGLAAAAALVAAGPGAILAASPAGAATHGTAASSCTVHWTGRGDGQLWTDARNWSTGKVPGPSDNVCIAGLNTNVLTQVSITVHSLRLNGDGFIDLSGTAASPITATATSGIMPRSATLTGGIEMSNATIKAAQIISHRGTIFTGGTSDIVSPDIVMADQSALEAFGGKTTVSSLSELSNGTLTGASVLAGDAATVVLPGDITHLSSAHVTVLTGSAIDDPAGHPVLSGLTSVDARSSLEDHNTLTLTSPSLTASGDVIFGPGTLAIAGPYTQAGHTLLVGLQSTVRATSVTIDHGAGFNNIGTGTVAGDLVNDGKTGILQNSTTHVTGNDTQAPGATLFTGFGNLLTVTGTATLAGSVSASETFTKTGDTTQLITFGSLAGGFTRQAGQPV